MRGELDRLQEAVAKRLVSMSEFAVADIFCEGSQALERGAGKACGVKITVKVPMPQKASKYAAGPVFSRVAVQVEIERDSGLARHSPGIASIAEGVSKALHCWSAPLECGYGKVFLSEQNPWTPTPEDKDGVAKICVNLSAQSVIE